MALSPFKTKYEQMAPYKKVTYLNLRSLRDGGAKTLIDDGPFDKIHKTAQSGRANCLVQLAKRIPDPFIDGDEVPVLVFDGDGPLPRVFDSRINQWVSPPRMTDHHKKVMEHYCAIRNQINDRAAQALREKQAKNEAALDEAAARTMQALGERAARATRATKPGAV